MLTQNRITLKLTLDTSFCLSKYLSILEKPSVVKALYDKWGFKPHEIRELVDLLETVKKVVEEEKVVTAPKKPAVVVEVEHLMSTYGMTLREAYDHYYNKRGQELRELQKIQNPLGLV